MYHRYFIICTILFLFPYCLYSQNLQTPDSPTYTIQGNVADSVNGEPLIGVTVLLKDSQKGTVTDSRGLFSLKLKSGNYILTFSYIGYAQKEIVVKLTRDMLLNISIAPVATILEEVRITSQRKFFGNLDKGRSIQQISSKDIQLENSNNVSDVLHARLSGIWATKTSGAPGDHIKIRVRGMSSLFASDDPLYVVDGVQVPNVNLKSLGIAHLNINDIDNITVLKDASSTALYGYQGGNGVIIIDTKRGGGNNEINFTTRQGVQWFRNYYDLMGTKDYLNSMDSSRVINGISIRSRYPKLNDTLQNVNWQDVIFQDGIVNEYQLSASGSKGKTNYYISGNYYRNKGIVKNSSYNKYSFSANLGRKFGKHFNIELSLKYNLQENKNNLDNYKGNSLLYTGINKPPCLKDIPDSICYVINDIDTVLTNYVDYYPLRAKFDPNEYIKKVNKTQDIAYYSAHLFLNYRLTDNLNFNFSTSFSYRNQIYNLNTEKYYFSAKSYYIESDENYMVFNHQYNLTYSKEFGEHNFKYVMGIKSYTDNVYWSIDSTNYPYKEKGVSFDPKSEFSQGTLAINGIDGAVIRSINSYVSHLNYTYKKRYNISLAIDYDRLKEGNYVDLKDFFPSVALNWNLALEPWLYHSWLNTLNLYTNFGKSGNYPLNALSNDLYRAKLYNYVTETSSGYVIDQLANHYLQPEKITETNFGVELSVLDKRITLKTDFFKKRNSDLIISREIPVHYGGGKMFLNSGEIKTRGIDLGLEAIPVSNSKITWQMNANVSFINQKIGKLDLQDTITYNSTDILFPEFRIIKGGELGDIYGYKYLGKYTTIDANTEQTDYIVVSGGKFLNPGPKTPETLKEDDKVKIGNSIPSLSWNLSCYLGYRNFSMNMLWYGVMGVEKYNATRAASYMTGTNREINDLIADSNAVYNNPAFYQSSFFVEDASFIRLKSLSFSYHPEKLLYHKIKVKLSVSLENMITITRYKGYDPETNIYTDNAFSDNAVDRGAYPIAKAFFISINFTL